MPDQQQVDTTFYLRSGNSFTVRVIDLEVMKNSATQHLTRYEVTYPVGAVARILCVDIDQVEAIVSHDVEDPS